MLSSAFGLLNDTELKIMLDALENNNSDTKRLSYVKHIIVKCKSFFSFCKKLPTDQTIGCVMRVSYRSGATENSVISISDFK